MPHTQFFCLRFISSIQFECACKVEIIGLSQSINPSVQFEAAHFERQQQTNQLGTGIEILRFVCGSAHFVSNMPNCRWRVYFFLNLNGLNVGEFARIIYCWSGRAVWNADETCHSTQQFEYNSTRYKCNNFEQFSLIDSSWFVTTCTRVRLCVIGWLWMIETNTADGRRESQNR